MTHDTKSTNTPFTHGISRRKLLSTLALGSTALGTGVMGTGVLGTSKLGTAVVSMSGEGRLAKLVSGRTPDTDSLDLNYAGVHDTLISPALAQSTADFVLSFGGGDQTSLSVTFTIDNLGQVRNALYSSTVVTGTVAGVDPIGWEEGSSIAVGTTDTVSDSVLFSSYRDPLIIGGIGDGISASGVAIIDVDTFSRAESDLAESSPSVTGIGPKVISGSAGEQATILPVLYRSGAELAYAEGDTQFQQGYENKLFFAGYYVRLHGGTAGWQYVPTAGGVSRDMDLEIPVVLDGVYQSIPLPNPVIVEAALGGVTGAANGYLGVTSDRYDFETVRLLPTPPRRTMVDAALDSAVVGVIPDGGTEEDRVFDTSGLVALFAPVTLPPGVTTTPAPGATMPAPATVTEAPDTPAPATVTEAPDTPAPATVTDAPDTPAPATVTEALDTPASGTTPTTTPTTTMMAGAGTPTSPTTPTTTPTTTMMAGAGTPTSPTTPTTAATTIAGTTTGGTTLVSTTLVSPTIAGELSVRGAINAQGNIGGDVARSLSGRLSSFRSRNRNKTGQRQQIPTRRR